MSEEIGLSIIVVSWNVRAHLERCLRSLEASGLRVRTIVVDNASSDGSAEFVRTNFPSVTLIENNTNRGFAAGVNQGLKLTGREPVLLLNPDCQVRPGALERCLNRLKAEPSIGVLGCRLLNIDGTTQGSMRRFPTLLDQALILLKLHRLFPNVPALRRYFMADRSSADRQDVDQVKGAFFLVSRTCLDRVGLLDERYWIWFEEVDYCQRAKAAGFRVVFTPEAEVVHASGESFRSVWTLRRQRYFTRSLLQYFRAYRPAWEQWAIRLLIPISLGLALIASPLSFVRAKILMPHG